MKILILFLYLLGTFPAQAQEDSWSYTDADLTPGKQEKLSSQERKEDISPSSLLEDMDPLESVNRVIFSFNEIFDTVITEPIGRMYRDLVPEFVRIRIGYGLRNLSEPIVFVNNILQGNLEEARVTFWRLAVNSTIGLGGLFDVSSSLGFSYKKQDFGLTLASWGVPAGSYIVLPVLGPSNLRDTFGRIGDYAFDPINWWAFFDDHAFYSYTRTAAQIIDAKTDNLDIMDDLRENSLDYYATIRAWYTERRKALMIEVSEREALDTPHPDDDDE